MFMLYFLKENLFQRWKRKLKKLGNTSTLVSSSAKKKIEYNPQYEI